MQLRVPLILALGAALAMPGVAASHSNDKKTAAEHERHHKPAHSDEKGGGHAAALGKPGAVGAATRTIEVAMGDDMRFKPDRIEVKRGETVRFVVRNHGQTKHEMVLGTMKELMQHAALMAKFPTMEHDDPNAASVDPGKSGEFTWTFTKAGNFDFACLIPGHFDTGMKGKMVVRK